jgi:hypothetical protein
LEYELEVAALELPSIAIVAQNGSPQRAIRARSEIRRTSQRYCFLVLVLSGSWHVTHVTRTAFGPGDLIFYDSRYPLDCDLLLHWSNLNLQLSEQFVRRWVPNPAVLSGRRICRDSQWGRVLASYVAQLSPQFVVQAPLPQAVLIDQLGALLALTASELSGRRAASAPVERSVRDQIDDHIQQRCPDASLQAADVASSLSISRRTLHRALAACGETFGAMLIQARVDLAVRMPLPLGVEQRPGDLPAGATPPRLLHHPNLCNTYLYYGGDQNGVERPAQPADRARSQCSGETPAALALGGRSRGDRSLRGERERGCLARSSL